MKRVLHVIAKIILSLILILPIAGATGILGEATRELYNTDIAFEFIRMIVETQYINYTMVVVHILALIALWTRREALAALLIAPITVNVFGFHAFIDGGPFTSGAVLANVMLLLNLYLLWRNRVAYANLLRPSA